jgi:hypothetical protein
MDCIWELTFDDNDEEDLTLLYINDLGFDINYPIQSIYNYENSDLEKVYWVDSVHQLRYANIKEERLIDKAKEKFDFVGPISMSSPSDLEVISGGGHTAGTIQFAYNQYNLNGAQTVLSPISELVAIGVSDYQGAELNDNTGSSVAFALKDLDNNYEYIKVYSIKYTSRNQLPEIKTIKDTKVSNFTEMRLTDVGTTGTAISIDELLNVGSSPVIPKHIEVKDNTLFLANIEDRTFILPEWIDTRAFSFLPNGTGITVYSEPYLENNRVKYRSSSLYNAVQTPPKTFSCINADYTTRNRKRDSTAFGGEGRHITFNFDWASGRNTDPNYRGLKVGEIYRFGIEFYNTLGQSTPASWIIDYMIPCEFTTGTPVNIHEWYTTVGISFSSEFQSELATYNASAGDNAIVGYRMLRAERTLADRTVICQGMVAPTQFTTTDYDVSDISRTNSFNLSKNRIGEDQDASEYVNYPTNFMRGTLDWYARPWRGGLEDYRNTHISLKGLLDHPFLARPIGGIGPGFDNVPFNTIGDNAEVFLKIDNNNNNTPLKAGIPVMNSTLMNLYSPDILFDSVTTTRANLEVRPICKVERPAVYLYGEQFNPNSEIVEESSTATLYPSDTIESLTLESSTMRGISYNGIIGPAKEGLLKSVVLHSKYNGNKIFYTSIYRNRGTKAINNTPVITQDDGKVINYNSGNKNYKFINNNSKLQTSGHTDSSLLYGNSTACKSLLFSTGFRMHENHSKLWGDNGIQENWGYINGTSVSYDMDTRKDYTPIVDIVKSNSELYISSQYGGNSYADKQTTSYLKIGDYITSFSTTPKANNPGDTYASEFTFLRYSVKSKGSWDITASHHTEIVTFPVETTVNLNKRHDISNGYGYDSELMPEQGDLHKYNTVYHQESTLDATTGLDPKLNIIQQFDTRIQATKKKIPNESVDAWTDVLVNEVIDLNGKHGPINSINVFNDKLFAFQDKAVAQIAVNPRVQVQAQDGVALELGTGGVLYDYDYVTDKTGSKNKWSVVSTKKGLYYYDILNKSMNRIPDALAVSLSEAKGLKTYFNNNFISSELEVDNPFINKGVVSGYDLINNDLYFTFHQGDKSFTRCYNELLDVFVDKKSYLPTHYLKQGHKFFMSTDNETLWESGAGEYNKFFGEYKSSYITLQLNPESDVDTVFNNIQYTSEVYWKDLNNPEAVFEDQPNQTLTHIHAYNNWQDSQRIPLVLGRRDNLRRRFREWRADIPRERRGRIRNPYIYLKLEFDPTAITDQAKSNCKLILHDIIVDYTV